MRRLHIIAIAILTFMVSCGTEDSQRVQELTKTTLTGQALPEGIEINLDTLDVSMNGRLRKAVLFQDKFYCMFETGRENTSGSFKKMIVIDKGGAFVEDVFIPEGIQGMFYYDMFIEDDSLFLKRTQFDEETFLLGKYVADFQQIERRNFSIYQDSSFKVYATCNGEWGGTIFFQDLKTKEVFETASTCAMVVNKIGNTYYVTNYMGHMMGHSSILEIADPTKLQKSQLNFDTRQGSRSHQGVQDLMDSTRFYIPTSFVVHGELRQLYSDEEGSYIGKIEKGKIVPIYKFDFVFYPNFNQQDSEGRQVLGFNIPQSESKGILVIDQGKLNFHFMH